MDNDTWKRCKGVAVLQRAVSSNGKFMLRLLRGSQEECQQMEDAEKAAEVDEVHAAAGKLRPASSGFARLLPPCMRSACVCFHLACPAG